MTSSSSSDSISANPAPSSPVSVSQALRVVKFLDPRPISLDEDLELTSSEIIALVKQAKRLAAHFYKHSLAQTLATHPPKEFPDYITWRKFILERTYLSELLLCYYRGNQGYAEASLKSIWDGNQ